MFDAFSCSVALIVMGLILFAKSMVQMRAWMARRQRSVSQAAAVDDGDGLS